jgi:hypothetical protein
MAVLYFVVLISKQYYLKKYARFSKISYQASKQDLNVTVASVANVVAASQVRASAMFLLRVQDIRKYEVGLFSNGAKFAELFMKIRYIFQNFKGATADIGTQIRTFCCSQKATSFF